MTSEAAYRLAFLVLLLALLAMRVIFMIKVRRSGERLLPDERAVQREGGPGFVILRSVLFLAILAFLGMYFAGMAWMDIFLFRLPGWLRWSGFAVGLLSVVFWIWTQIHLDTQWSAQLQLKRNHQLVTTGPYASIRHPLYLGMMGWAISVSLLTANWIFVAVCVLSIIGVVVRVPKEEQMMIEAFGDEYKAYMQRTGRYFPKLSKGKIS
jgi:protein-S-isoprenylcysteine O-methyltransferase Ste14